MGQCQFVTFQTSNKYILKNVSNKNSILNEKDATDLPNYKGVDILIMNGLPIWLLNLDSNLSTGLEIVY